MTTTSHLHGEESGHSSTSFTGMDTLTLSAPSPSRFSWRDRNFSRALGPSLIRAKGYIHLSTGPSLVQWAGSELECKPSTFAATQRGYLTLIGHRLDKNRIIQEWESLLSGVVQ